MKGKIVFTLNTILILVLSALLAACSGGGSGGSGGSVSGLTVAEQVSVVDSQQSSGKVRALTLGKLYLSPSDVPANSDYYNDRQEVYVHERSAEAFNIINEILCVMGQTRYDSMVNAGDYKAQIDNNQCSRSKDDAASAGQSSQNQSSGSTAPDYEMWTVNSSRASSSAPHIVKVWFHEDAMEQEPAKAFFIKVTITEGKSDTNPYGLFIMNFKAYPENNGVVDTSAILFKGFLKTEVDSATDDVLLKFILEGSGDLAFNERVVLNRTVDGSSGSGTAYASDPWNGESSFNIAFNSTYFLRADANNTDQKCFSRTSFDETAWDYGLYSSSGSRLTRNSGFSIKKDNYYGWIGYYGLWLPEEAGVNNGDTVYRVAYGQGGETATPYTVVKKGGRFKKHTRNTTTLGAIRNVPLDWWDNGTSARVKWTGSQFVKFAQMNQQTYFWENITESPLDLSALTFGELNFWSQSLGGQVRVKLACTWNEGSFSCSAPTDNSQVIFFKEDVVFPGDTVPASLRCYDNCPKYTLATGGVKPADPTYSPDYNPSDGTDSHDYTFSSSAGDMVLKDDGNALLWVSDGSGQNQWGVMSGPLFDPSGANLALLACDDWNQNGEADEGTCGWKAWSELSEYYTWETGPAQWNQFTALRDSDGNVLEFEAPLQVLYVHSQTNSAAPDYKYNGVSFYLEYSGFGSLHGIPGACLDKDTGEPVTCGPGTRWAPEFTIADGSDLTDGNNNEYLAKALRKEQRMSNIGLNNCSSLLMTSYTLPLIDRKSVV